MATNLTIDESVTTVNISGVAETAPAYTTITLSNDQGAQGIQGIQGLQGLKGDQGDKGDIGLTGPVSNVSGTLPISVDTGTTTPVVSIASATTSVAGAVQLSDSTSTTSSVLAATSTAVKSAYDLASNKVSSVLGTLPISVTAGTSPTVSIAAGTTSVAGAVQLIDSVSSSSTAAAATANSARNAYNRGSLAVTNAATAQTTADSKVASVTGTAPIAVTSGTTPIVSIDQAALVLDTSQINWSSITAWAPSTSYTKGALVEYQGIAYRRSVTGTSGLTFNTANWQQITPTPSSINTANTLVIRDGSGNFSAGTIAAALTGNASTATAVAASGISGTTLASNVVTSSLTTVGTITSGTWNATAIDISKGGTGHPYGSPLVGKASLSTTYPKAVNDTTPEAVFRNAAGTIQYLNVEANATYLVEGVLALRQQANVGGAAARLSLIYLNTGTSTALGEVTASFTFSNTFGTATYASSSGVVAANVNADATFTSALAFTHHIVFRGLIQTNASLAGRINIGATQSVAGTSLAPTFLAGSFLNVYKMPGSGLVQTLGNWS